VLIDPGHTHTDARVDIDAAADVLPPYLEVVYCQSPDLAIDAGLIGLFDDSAPSGWTRFSALDGKFPKGADTYGGTGGSATHTHDTSGGYTTGSEAGSGNGTSHTNTSVAEGHTHTTQDGNTQAGNSLPSYLEMVYASIDSDGVGEADSILIVSALPPLGWQRFSALDDAFPRGASSYGGTGGSETHTHDVTIATGGPSATGGSKAIGQTTADASHTHSCNTTTDAGSNIPPYMDVIFAQRNDPAVSTSVGSEEVQETEPGEEEVTYNYVYNGDGAMVMESTGAVTTIYIGGIYEYVISGAEVITRSYYYAGSQRVAMRENDTLFYLLGDHLGSTSLTLDANGNKVAEQRYKPYGSTRYEWGTAQTNYQFTGQRKIDLGIYYYQARFYDASLGQFLSPDTIIPSPGNVLDWNRYLYTRGNPVRYLDPSGHICVDFAGGKTCTEDSDSNGWWRPAQRPHIDETTLKRIAFLVWADAGRGQVEQYSYQALSYMSWVFFNRYNHNRYGGHIDMDTGGTPYGLDRVGYPYDGTTDLNKNIDAAVEDLLDLGNKDHESFTYVLGVVDSTYQSSYSALDDDPTKGALFFTLVNQNNTVEGKHFSSIEDSKNYLNKWSSRMAAVYTPVRAFNDNSTIMVKKGGENG
jgi:RHS repeat-associated protein